MASTIESEIGKNPWLTLNSPYYSNAYVYVKHTLQKTPERLRPLKVKLGKPPINIGYSLNSQTFVYKRILQKTWDSTIENETGKKPLSTLLDGP